MRRGLPSRVSALFGLLLVVLVGLVLRRRHLGAIQGISPLVAPPTERAHEAPSVASAWLGPPDRRGVYPLDPRHACAEALAAPYDPGADVTPAPRLSQLEHEVTARLRPKITGAYQSREDEPEEPRLRTRDSGVRDLVHGWGESTAAYREMLDRSLPIAALLAVDMSTETRVYAIAEPVALAQARLLHRANQLAPRVACGNHDGWLPHHSHPEGSYATMGVPEAGIEPIMDVDASPPKPGWELVSATLYMWFSDVDGNQTYFYGLRRVRSDDATIVITTKYGAFAGPVVDALDPLF